MVQADDAIFMTKGLVSSVVDTREAMEVVVDESLLDERISITSDMVVLATGMVPNTARRGCFPQDR